MIIYTDIEQLPKIPNLVLTIGTFDGVHNGHKELISSINKKSKSIHGKSGLITFHPHPRMIIQPNTHNSIQLLTTLEERIQLLEQTGLNYLFIVPFSVDFANQPAEEYIRHFLVEKFHPKEIIIGYDHKFGKDRIGDVTLLESMSKEFQYTVTQVSQQKVNDITFSSTNIRNSLLNGDIKTANQLLGYNYTVKGVVTHGDKRGTKIGYPTANVEGIAKEKLIPAQGVYATTTIIDDNQYSGMLNIGTRPTFKGSEKTIENHIFEFNETIYGKHIQIVFLQRIRDEQKFASKTELINQLHKDKEKAQSIIRK